MIQQTFYQTYNVCIRSTDIFIQTCVCNMTWLLNTVSVLSKTKQYTPYWRKLIFNFIISWKVINLIFMLLVAILFQFWLVKSDRFICHQFKVSHSSASQTISVRSVYIKIILTVYLLIWTKRHATKKQTHIQIVTRFTRDYWICSRNGSKSSTFNYSVSWNCNQYIFVSR